MKNLILPLFASLLLFASCQEEEILTPSSSSAAQYISWTEGDWWVYQWTVYNYYTSDTTVFFVDTIFALEDTIINGEVYRTLSRGFHSYEIDRKYLRDSSGYVIDSLGRVVFANTNFGDTLVSFGENGFNFYSMMVEDQLPTVVPAGIFSTINYKTTSWVDGMSFFCNQDTIAYSDRQFAESVGFVRFSDYTYSPGTCLESIRVLTDYNIQ